MFGSRSSLPSLPYTKPGTTLFNNVSNVWALPEQEVEVGDQQRRKHERETVFCFRFDWLLNASEVNAQFLTESVHENSNWQIIEFFVLHHTLPYGIKHIRLACTTNHTAKKCREL